MLLTKAAHPKDVMLHDFALALLNKKAQEDNAHHKHARYTMIGKTFEHKGPLHPDHLTAGPLCSGTQSAEKAFPHVGYWSSQRQHPHDWTAVVEGLWQQISVSLVRGCIQQVQYDG